MRFQELAIGSSLLIDVSIGNKKASFRGILVKHIKGDYFSIILDTPQNSKQALSFKGCYISVTSVMVDGPVRWGGCAIQFMKDTYVLYVPNRGVTVDRRTSNRVDVRIYGTMEYKKQEYPIVIRDISLVGIGFEMAKGVTDLQRGEMVGLKFEDCDFAFESSCQVARISEFNNNVVYGCVIKGISRHLTQYLNFKIAEKR